MPRKYTKKVAKTKKQEKMLKSIHPPNPESETEDQQEYEIEKLVDVRGEGDDREFFVKWLNWSSDTNTWEKADGLPQKLIDEYDAQGANTSDEEDNKDASPSPPPVPPRQTRSRGRPRKVPPAPSSLDPPKDEDESSKKSKSTKSRKSDRQQRAQKKKKKTASQDHPSDADVESSPSIVVVIDDEHSSVETPAPVEDNEEDATPEPPRRPKRSKRAKRRRPIDDGAESEDVEQPATKRRKLSAAKRTRPGATTRSSMRQKKDQKKDDAKEEEKADELQKDDSSPEQTPTPMDVDDADDANGDDQEYLPETEELNDDDDDAEDEEMTVTPRKRRLSSSTSMDVAADDLSSELNDKKDEVDEQDDGDNSEDGDGDGGDDDDAQWEVEKIVGCRAARKAPRSKGGKKFVEYKVKWRGWGVEHNSWVHENDCAGCGKLIEAFEKSKESADAKTKRRRTRPGPRSLENSVSPVSTRPKRTQSRAKADKNAVAKWKSWVNNASSEEMRDMLLDYADRASSREISKLAQDFRMNLDSP